MNYDKIIIIMGKKYREVLSLFFDNKFCIVLDIRGIGGYKSLISNYLKLPTPQLLQKLNKFQSPECAEYLWSVWDFAFPHKYKDLYRPYCYQFCCYNKENEFSSI